MKNIIKLIKYIFGEFVSQIISGVVSWIVGILLLIAIAFSGYYYMSTYVERKVESTTNAISTKYEESKQYVSDTYEKTINKLKEQ